MSHSYNKNLIARAKELRKNMTPTERKLWYEFLSRYPIRIQRQKTIENYIADFYCHSCGIIIEIDGGQHYDEDAREHDEERTRTFESIGCKVIRFTNTEVLNNFEIVCQEIDRALSPPVTP